MGILLLYHNTTLLYHTRSDEAAAVAAAGDDGGGRPASSSIQVGLVRGRRDRGLSPCGDARGATGRQRKGRAAAVRVIYEPHCCR